MVPPQYHWVYRYNPVAAVVLSCRTILLEARVETDTLVKLAVLSVSFLAAGFFFFNRMKKRFADYL
jgi:ABC-type polysaccharide/polyol phosphate export permease